jgi:hypothetical protein
LVALAGFTPDEVALTVEHSVLTLQADHVALFQTISDAAGSGGNRLRSLGRGNGGLARPGRCQP